MPPPRLCRHLRPCRAPWSGQQVRFASDRPRKTGEGEEKADSGSVRYARQFKIHRPAPQLRILRSFTDGERRMREAEGRGKGKEKEEEGKKDEEKQEKEKEKEEKQVKGQKQQSETTGQKETSQTGSATSELHERLQKLEEQLAEVQAKLAAERARPAQEEVKMAPQEEGKRILAQEEAKTAPPQARAAPANMTVASRASAALPTPTAPTASPAPDASSSSSSSSSSTTTTTATATTATPSLLDELFPSPTSSDRSAGRRPAPPKLDLPAPDSHPHIRLTPSDSRTAREKAIDSFRARGEHTTVLQLSHCSTALTEHDFRRLLPRGRHIDTWSSTAHFYHIIPGRDPLSLARLPFYYLLFHSPQAALAYQKNASRLSKLAALHAPSGIASALQPPAGFLEDGEDIAALTASFVLHPQGHALDLRTVMQPYNNALRALIDAGGYTPIVPNTDDKGAKIHRVLLHIDGYEPSHWDLWQILARHAHVRGIIWPFRNDHPTALRRLRDAINLRTVGKQKFQATAATNPRAAASTSPSNTPSTDALEYEDPNITSFLGTASSTADANSAKELNQLVMNRLYNRWIVELEDEDAARRFATLWHRVLLPNVKDKKGAWREAEEDRWVEAEYLW